MPDASLELPYDGAKLMLLVDNVENRDFLNDMIHNSFNIPSPLPYSTHTVDYG